MHAFMELYFNTKHFCHKKHKKKTLKKPGKTQLNQLLILSTAVAVVNEQLHIKINLYTYSTSVDPEQPADL